MSTDASSGSAPGASTGSPPWNTPVTPGTRTPHQRPVYDPALVVEAMRSWLKAQAEPDPEVPPGPAVTASEHAYDRSLRHLEELVQMFMSR